MEKAFNGCMSLCDLVIYRIGGRGRSGEDRRVKLKFESFRPKDGYVKITNLGTGYSVGDCEIINGSDIDNWNSSYCARLQIELTADDGYEFRKKRKIVF